ncbi:hypothetical protein BaRGS_00002638 [Batillaria attramentaria]|uniref:Uncharacterized protein n=1 Tax=Batillaria attramentaria TaxID=370345 RepID=A0ABD0M2F3_9CAEN
MQQRDEEMSFEFSICPRDTECREREFVFKVMRCLCPDRDLYWLQVRRWNKRIRQSKDAVAWNCYFLLSRPILQFVVIMQAWFHSQQNVA